MSERKIFNFKSEMLAELTIKNEGYHPDTFGKTSNKFIWATCRFCGEPSRLRKGQFIKKGSACHKECRFKEQSISGSPFANPEVKEKTRQTNLARYGVEHASQNKEIANRISQSRMTEESKAKSANTNLDRYGVVNPFQSEEIKKKIKQTNLEKYGTEHAMQSDEIKKKTTETLKSKYGVDNLANIPGAKDKKIRTNIDRYGCANPMQNKNIKDKAMKVWHQTVIEDPNDNYKLINTLRGNEFWERMKDDITLQKLCEEFDINYQSATSRLLHDEFRDKYYEIYSFPRTQEQKRLNDIIRSFGFKTSFNDRSIIPPLEIDIVVPEKMLAIEFNGNFWHSEAKLSTDIAKFKHLEKTRKCQQTGYRLFHIFEHHWKEREFQIMNFLKSLLGVNEKTIFARNCNVNNNACADFIENNHMQGCGKNAIRYFNLEYNGEIIASMVASTHHRQNADLGAIVLSRLCFKSGVHIPGGASKLFNKFIEWAKNSKYNSVVSWSDNLWTNGGIYEKLGFILEQEYPPDYFYWHVKKHVAISKQSQQKKKTGCPEGMTEREWCIQNNLYRIWDCGKKKWTYRLEKDNCINEI